MNGNGKKLESFQKYDVEIKCNSLSLPDSTGRKSLRHQLVARQSSKAPPPQHSKLSKIKTNSVTLPAKAESDGPVHIPKGKVIAGWRVIGKLGEGACGSVYKAQHTKHMDKFAAIKAEVRNANKGNVLKLEVAVLKRVRDKPLMPKIYASGKKANFEYCVMTLYGESISHLISKLKSRKTSVSTQVRIGIHGLAGLKFLHDSGFVHRDVKPANMLMGVDGTAEEKFVHCCDFGLAREFVQLSTDDTGRFVYKLRPPRERAPFRGTARYCSIATHERKEQGRVDDLWALFYTLAEFRTSLPWSSLKYDSREQIAQVKQMCPDEMLYGNSPAHFLKIASHLRYNLT
ncbi:hypothetical protein WR25_09600 [Diploscapter pachys]|uniref:non-specific serine/threonine protein kinase n=1 Tax=Diploscapter pachys TaxID=2018661 RepID=A0A2A2LK59_9BILA|nr:hypothetical protein WR25_09600 [Diploscapter pachys]